MNRHCHRLRCCLLLTLLACCTASRAATVADLQATGRLQLRSWLVPAQNIVPGQQVKLNLEIATDRWFAGGTRIKIPEVPGLVILQTDNFASNSSEQRKGQSWVIQRWILEVYAQRDGQFTIPPLNAYIKVNDDGSEAVEGEVTSPALHFTAVRPESLARVQHWVAAPDFTVSQSFDYPLEHLAVGDAIERQLSFEAGEIMAMMLPSFVEEPIAGLTAYPEPPVLDNTSNRGVTAASRTQRITYIAESEGVYQLPAQDYFWWDTRTGELQLLSLPTVDIVVGNIGATSIGNETTELFKPTALMGWAGRLLLLGLVLWWCRSLPIGPALNFLAAGGHKLLEQWHKLRKPALPDKLNPGNSAAD